MKSLLAFIAVLVLLLLSVGYMRGWYSISPVESQDESKINYQITIDKNKPQQDLETVEQKAKEGLGKLKGDSNSDTTPPEPSPKQE